MRSVPCRRPPFAGPISPMPSRWKHRSSTPSAEDPRAWIPELSLVSVDDTGDVVAHVVCPGPGWGRSVIPCSASARSVSVPTSKAGHRLRRRARRDRRRERPHRAVDRPARKPGVLRPLRLRRSTDHGIDPPDPAWGEHFQVLPLTAHDTTITGTFQYAAAFG